MGDFICSVSQSRFFGGEQTGASLVWKSRYPRVETSSFRDERGKVRNRRNFAAGARSCEVTANHPKLSLAGRDASGRP
jgi:hypothetical protein